MNTAEARAAIERGKNLNAFISLTAEEGDGPVVAVKDLIDVHDTVTTAGGKPGLWQDEPAEMDAPLIGNIRRFGCTVIGKANLHEWAYGVTSNNPWHGAVSNPHDPERIAGGSSGGSAVAVAAGMCDWAVGSDTGGSIRIPAALCGCVGFKPSLRFVGIEQVVPLSHSLDTIGPLAPDVRTAARALEMLSGESGIVPDDQVEEFNIAVPQGWVDDLDEPTRLAWEQVSEGLPEIEFPDLNEMGKPGSTVLLVEASSFHAVRLADDAHNFGRDVRANLERGFKVSAVEYVRAVEDLLMWRFLAEGAMSDYDAILVPTCPRVAPKIAESEDVRPLLTRYTRPFNVTGQPVISLPFPVEEGELPVGIQVVGHFGSEDIVAAVAAWLEAKWRKP